MMMLMAAINATPDPPTSLQALSDNLVLVILQRADIVTQVQFAFCLPAYYLKWRVVLLPNLIDALFNHITPDLILNELITILCQQSLYNTVVLTLFRKATYHQIVGLYDRLLKMQNEALIEKLYAAVNDAKFRRLIDALRRPDLTREINSLTKDLSGVGNPSAILPKLRRLVRCGASTSCLPDSELAGGNIADIVADRFLNQLYQDQRPDKSLFKCVALLVILTDFVICFNGIYQFEI
jgi:hypothetical protein